MRLSFSKMLINIIALVLLIPITGLAQQSKPLALNEAILMARTHSSRLRSDSLQYQIAGEKVGQSAVNALPQIGVNLLYQRLSNNITPFTITLPTGNFQLNPQVLNQSYNSVQLTQLISSGGRLAYNTKALKKEAAANKADYDKSLLELDFQVTDLWFNLYNTIATQKIILGNIEVLTKKRADLENYRIQGIVLANDVLKLDLAVTELKSSLADISSVEGNLNYALCTVIGIDPKTVIEIPESYLNTPVATEPLQLYIDAALAKRPEVKSFQYRSEAANLRIKAANAEYFPTLNLFGSYNYDQPNQRIIPNQNSFNYTAYAGASLSWRISSFYTNKPRVRESKLSALQLSNNFIQAKENILVEVNANYLEYKKTLEKIILIHTQLDQATENFRVEQNKLNAQTTTPTDFLDANTKLLQAQLNLTTAVANAGLAYHKLIKSTGETAN